jgi:hypothetical protein
MHGIPSLADLTMDLERTRARDRPPKIPLVFSMGVTGHRLDALSGRTDLRERLRGAMITLAARAAALAAAEARFFSAAPPRIILVSPLADGADQMAAEIALELGFELHAVLPFARSDYRQVLLGEAEREGFDSLLERSGCVLELPGDRSDQLDAYVMTGRATVAHCDVLLAVWDGLAPRGRGGTGEVVQLAVVNGTPVVHVPIGNEPSQILWSAFDPAVITHSLEKTTQRPFEQPFLDQMLSRLLMPPLDRQERTFLSIFTGERGRRIRARIEYPLLLAAAGVARFDPRKTRDRACEAEIRAEWQRYREGCADAHQIAAPLDLLESSYSWSDRLATHFAQTYRSGHIFNFALGGIAVCIGLSAFMVPGANIELAIAEFIITLAIILNTRIGVKNEWHRRWLDYRQLAERLRPMRSLKLLGLGSPDPPGSRQNPVPKRWIDWYSIGIWRAMGCPHGAITTERASRLAKAIAQYEVAPQVAYHERHAQQIEALDSRLEWIAGVLFFATLVVSAIVTLGLWLAPAFVNDFNNWFTLVSAGFPALGTAVFGIRFQGDFGGSATRSQATSNTLRQIEDELNKDVTLARAADLTEQAARTMLIDLDEWRLVNQQQDLDLA